jgi:hypothetical protein
MLLEPQITPKSEASLGYHAIFVEADFEMTTFEIKASVEAL